MSNKGNCRLCNSKKIKSLSKFINLDIPFLSYRFFKPYSLEGIRDVKICLNCQFVQNVSNSREKNYINYYKKYNKHKVRKNFDEKIDTDYFVNLVSWSIKNKIIFKNKLVLDFGSGGNILKKVCQKQKTNFVFNWDVNNINTKKKFDILISTHVLEHVYDFKKLFRTFQKLLKEESYVIIAVPNILDYKKYYYGAYNNYDVEHINHFSPSSLSNLLEMNNYEIVAIKTGSRVVSRNLRYSETVVIAKKSKFYETKNIKFIEYKKFKKNLKEYFNKSNLEFKKSINSFKRITKNLQNNQKLIIYGISSTAVRFLNYLKKEEFNRINYLADSDTRIKNKKFKNKRIIDQNEFKKISKISNITVIIKAVRGKPIYNFLIKNFTFLKNKIFII